MTLTKTPTNSATYTTENSKSNENTGFAVKNRAI